LHAPFFPPEIFQGYFNPKKKRKTRLLAIKQMNLEEMKEEDEQQGGSENEPSDAGSQENQSDYDVEEEYDNDYADNYFDNGENDEFDDLGGGGEDYGGRVLQHLFTARYLTDVTQVATSRPGTRRKAAPILVLMHSIALHLNSLRSN
jgi:hypothetical protein